VSYSLSPRPIVTPIIVTGARQGMRAALLIGGGIWLSLARRPG
jgi:threonine/homoserine/homoserine lactone efflux protein